jgi:hypothetical protein
MRTIRVTEPLGVYFDKSKIPAHVLDAASDRGIDAHAACAAYAKKLPVWVGNGAYPYFQSFRGWFDRFVAKVYFVEQEFDDNQIYFIKGHPDIGARLVDGRDVIVDYKTPQVESRTWAAQIAAYSWLAKLKTGIDFAGMALILDRDGKDARAITYQYTAQDWAAYLAALTAYRWFKK